MPRHSDVDRFYSLLDELETKKGGKRNLSECHGRMGWPARGVYFFFDSRTNRCNGENRLVRIGTHALKAGSQTTLWKRLSQHKGTTKSGGGNHRGSIFRLLVGNALIGSGKHGPVRSWGLKQDMGKAAKSLGVERQLIKKEEFPLELAVSHYIGNLPFLWLAIEDEPGPDSQRGYIERNSIALVSEYNWSGRSPNVDNWLGSFSDRQKVQRSRLWNSNHVDEEYDPEFLALLKELVQSK